MKKIVTIGGGSGHFNLLRGLSKIPDFDITAIVNMVDNGGSSGILRDRYGALPPGDLLKALLALSQYPDEITRKILLTRFQQNNIFQGHNAGNLMITLFHQFSGNFLEALSAVSEILHIRGQVLPVTIGNIMLHAVLENGNVIHGETNIDIPKHDANVRIKRVFLDPNAHALGEVIESIRVADMIIFAPGDLWTSTIPVLCVKGIMESLAKTRAMIVMFSNLMSKHGETDGYGVRDFVKILEQYMKKPCDLVLCNAERPSPEVLQKYEAEHASWITYDPKRDDSLFVDGNRKLLSLNLLEEKDGLIRHSPEKLHSVFQKILDLKHRDEIQNPIRTYAFGCSSRSKRGTE